MFWLVERVVELEWFLSSLFSSRISPHYIDENLTQYIEVLE